MAANPQKGIGLVAAAVLDRDDALMGDDVEQGRLFESHAGAVRDVVKNDRDAGGIGNSFEKRFKAGLGRADVIRWRHQQTRYGTFEDFIVELQQLGQIVAGQAHDQPPQPDEIDGAVLKGCNEWNPDTLKRGHTLTPES